MMSSVFARQHTFLMKAVDLNFRTCRPREGDRRSFALHWESKTMKISAVAFLLLQHCAAFVPAALRPSETSLKGKVGISAELDLPFDQLETFPNLPDSVHPGVLSGQATVDLLNHAKENGECAKFSSFCLYLSLDVDIIVRSCHAAFSAF